MKVSLRRLREARSFDETQAVIKDMLAESREKKDEIFISDLIINDRSGGAFPLLERLRKDHGKRYFLKVIKDQWGRPVKPGDVVKRIFKEPLHRVPGTPISSAVISASVKAGTFADDFLHHEEFVIDDKGCIHCSADDMFYFLTHFGVHCYSRETLSMHPNETSGEPAKVPGTGEMKHRHYWLYEEVETKEYEKLPSLTAQKK